MKGLIDTHFHLDHYRDYLDKAKQISQLEQYTICVTNSPGVFRSCKNLMLETEYLKFALGYHPLDGALNKTDLQDFLKQLSCSNYIGEIGLDYSNRSTMEKQLQLYAFETIVEAGTASNKVMSIHIRNAEEDAIQILKKYNPRKAIIHWYNGSSTNMDRLLEIGCFFSVNSNMINAKKQNCCRAIPKNRILVESDGPYSKVNRKPYTPEMLLTAYQNIAKFFDDAELVKTVFGNFKTLLTQ